MRIYYISISFLFVIFSCQNDSKDQLSFNNSGLGSLFIIGGGTRPNDMVLRMIEESPLDNKGYVVILPMASEIPDSAVIWSSEQFKHNGVKNITGFNFLPNVEPSADWLDSLKNASLIYISGGDQNRFMNVIRGSEIERAIHEAFTNGAMIAGTSAGAAVMSHIMITGNELKSQQYRPTFQIIESDNIETSEGLGLINSAIVDQHFIIRSRHNRLISSVIEFPELKGIGIDESTAILVQGDSAEVVGSSQVMVFQNPDRSHKEKYGKLGVRNLRIDIYLPGEKFSIQ
jgi:cyanophycinase